MNTTEKTSLLKLTGELTKLHRHYNPIIGDAPYYYFVLCYESRGRINQVSFQVRHEDFNFNEGDYVTVAFIINAVSHSTKPDRFINLLHVAYVTMAERETAQ